MASPKPYGVASLNNSPLAADGSDFPCKQRPGVYDAAGVSNVMPIGAPQTLSFIGGATHSGGSCQISLTKDLKPTKDSKWMVIHSIEGGCPDKTPGNLSEDSKGTGSTKFQYSIPQGISPGQYTLAWTWFNQGGNREMYMNCAPVTVTGGGKKRDVEDAPSHNATEEYGSDEIFKRDVSFPDMYRANIDPGCTTSAQYGKDLIFPHPGASVERAGLPGKLMAAEPCGDKANAGSSSSPKPASGSGPAAGAASPAPTSIVAIPPPSASGMGMASAAASVASAAQSVASIAASVVSGAGMASPATPTGSASSGSSNTGSSSGSSSSGSSGGVAAAPAAAPAAPAAPAAAPAAQAPVAAAPGSMACSTLGQTVCSADGMKFGTCDTNKMAVMMAVAGGTKCSGGQIMMAGGPQKRSAKFARFYNA
ncbi:MAG: hypothetical protein Q9212_005835 [Teloschistes hypoglaucus]